jgi:hypothetical protein
MKILNKSDLFDNIIRYNGNNAYEVLSKIKGDDFEDDDFEDLITSDFDKGIDVCYNNVTHHIGVGSYVIYDKEDFEVITETEFNNEISKFKNKFYLKENVIDDIIKYTGDNAKEIAKHWYGYNRFTECVDLFAYGKLKSGDKVFPDIKYLIIHGEKGHVNIGDILFYYKIDLMCVKLSQDQTLEEQGYIILEDESSR